ncbi:MAG: hypothetical protein RLY86_2049 [Pseudomonadota bacterium]|jgi:acetyl esterase/lipase
MSKDQVDALRAMLAARPQVGADVAARRAAFEATGRRFAPPPDVAVQPVVFTGDPGVAGLRLTPPGAVAGRTLLFLHGGAFVVGSSRTHAGLAAAIAREARADAIVTDYRLVPEHPFPAALEDAVTAWAGLLAGGADPARCAVLGDSAGANLAVALCLRAKALDLPLPGAIGLISPYLDLTHSGAGIKERAGRDPFIDASRMDYTAAMYLGGASPTNPLCSPLFGDLAGLPPVLVQVGTEEVLYDDATRFAAAATAAGVPVMLEVWEDMIHVFPFFRGQIDEAEMAVASMGRFLDERLG